MQRVCRRLEGAFTLVAVDAQDPDRVVAARRNSPAGRRARRGRELPRLRRRRVHRAHPRGAGARPGPGRHDHPRGRRRSPASTAAPPRARRYHVDWDLSAAEKDGYDWFMRKEIFEQPRAVADSLLGRRTPPGAAAARRDAALRRGAARRRQDHHHRLRHVVLRRHGREVRHRALDPDPGARSSWPRSSATATRSSTTRRWSSRSASPARPPTPCRRSGTPGCSGSKVLAICNTNGSTIPRESDAVIYTHAGPRSGSRRPRAS